MKRLRKGAERRKFRRVEAKLRIAFRNLKELKSEYTKNISRGGLFLKTDRLLDPNTEIELTIHLPNDRNEINVKGKVVRSMVMSDPGNPGEQIYGVGIRFINLDGGLTRKIEELLEQDGG